MNKTGLKLGTDVALALDVAATEFYTDGTGYKFEGKNRTAAEMAAFYAELIDAYPLVSIEDPLDDIGLVASPDKNFMVIMKDGRIYKDTLHGG